jgi:nicotinamide phosphoribosyltransferase
MKNNVILNTDSYKCSHYLQYPPGTEYISSYIESRGSDVEGWTECTFYGLQMFLKEYLTTPFTQADIDEADELLTAHGVPFNRKGWQYILKEHGGYLPVRIQAAPEGTNIPLGNVLVQIINTDPNVPWLTSYVETSLLRAVWYPTTVATQDRYIKESIRAALHKTSDSQTIEADMLFKLHGFGGRGASSLESAGIGESAHLVHFMGTDTIEGLRYARAFYGCSMAGFSIPAAEHSTITVWGGPKQEINAFENMIRQFGGEGKLYAVVSDSYDIYASIEKWHSLKDLIVEKGGTLVVRPDSGHPATVVLEVLNRMGELFGYTMNDKKYKVLPDFIRVIQGDGINHISIGEILDTIIAAGWSADNLAFGMGGAMLQGVNRDTLNFAMKASDAKVEGLWRDVYKDPVTQSMKKSKRGRLALIKKNGEFSTIRQTELPDPRDNLLVTVFEDGRLVETTSFDEIRERALAA